MSVTPTGIALPRSALKPGAEGIIQFRTKPDGNGAVGLGFAPAKDRQLEARTVLQYLNKKGIYPQIDELKGPDGTYINRIELDAKQADVLSGLAEQAKIAENAALKYVRTSPAGSQLQR